MELPISTLSQTGVVKGVTSIICQKDQEKLQERGKTWIKGQPSFEKP